MNQIPNDSDQPYAGGGLLQRALLVSYYGLILYFLIVSLGALDSLSVTTPVIWLIQIFPLLIFAPGLHRSSSRTYLWLSLVALLYFMHGVLVAFEPARLWWGLTEITLCVILFTLLMLCIRAKRPKE